MIFLSVYLIAVIYLSYILIADGAAGVKHFPEIINWRIPNQNEACYIETLFSNVINYNSAIKYHVGKRISDSRPHEIKTVNLDGNKPIVWQLCDAVDINIMGMTALAADKNLARVIENNKFAKVCRLINHDQLDALPAGSVYLLISDNRENIIASYLFNSDEMEANQDNYKEYQKSYGLTLGAIVS
jgi:hypothetical protein